MSTPGQGHEARPSKYGTCDYCCRETTVYAYVLWVCRRCLLEADRRYNRANATQEDS
jgi:ribosomal protein S14